MRGLSALSILLVLVAATVSDAGTGRGRMRTGPVDAPGPMSVVVITSDDTAPVWHEASGRFSPPPGPASMPNLDRMADEGVVFPRAIVSAQCTPTRKALWTGMLAQEQSETPSDRPWLPARFKSEVPNSGTFAAGKWGIGYSDASNVSAIGFDRFLGNWGNFVNYNNTGSTADWSETRTPQIQTRTPGTGYPTAETVDDFRTLIAEHRAAGLGPFLAWASFNVPHFGQADSNGNVTWPPPSQGPPWNNCTVQSSWTPVEVTYRDETCAIEMLEHPTLGLDWGIGEIENSLTGRERRNTCFIYHNDNGAEPGFAGNPFVGNTIYRGKSSASESGSEAIFVFSGACVKPDAQSTPSRGNGGVMHIDMAPTIAELAGFTLAEQSTNAHSIAGILDAGCGSGACDDVPERAFNYSSNSSGSIAWVRFEDRSYSLSAPVDGSASSLYSLATDEKEQVDLCAGDCKGASLSPSEQTACQDLVNFAASVNSSFTSFTCAEDTPVTPALPNAVTNLALTPSLTEISATWSSGGGGTESFRIRHCEGASCSEFGNAQTTTSTSATISGLTSSTAYRVEVIALNSVQQESASVIGSTTTSAPALPPAPSNLAVLAAASSADLSWTSGGGSTVSFQVGKCAGAGCTNFTTSASLNAITGTSVILGGLTPNQQYRAQIFARNSAGALSGPATIDFETLSVTTTQCVDGVDCRCDQLVQTYGSDIVFCEDFENPTLGNPGVWQTTGGGWGGQAYSGINMWCKGLVDQIPRNATSIPDNDMTNNNGCVYLLERGDASSQPGDGPSETGIPLADQTFDGNTTLMQTVRPPDPGFTVTATDGSVWALQQPGGFHGNAGLDRLVTSFGITSARYTATGITAGSVAWKGNQYTPANAALTGTYNTTSCSPYPTGIGTNLEPYSGTMWKFDSSDPNDQTMTNNVGSSCSTGTTIKTVPAEQATPLAPRGEWVCQQVQYENWGQTNGRVRHWIDGQLVIDTDIDLSTVDNSWIETDGTGLLNFKWNNYWNGNSLGGPSIWDGVLGSKNQGYGGTNWSGRLQDNLVIKEGAPVSCAEIGF